MFDTILLDHVAEMGADVRQEARVTEVVVEDDRVVGVRFDHDGEPHEARAPYVVDASGLNAVVANKLSSREPAETAQEHGAVRLLERVPTRRRPSWAATSAPTDRNNIIIKMLDTGWLWFIPLGFGDMISVGYVTQRDRLPEGKGRAGLEEHYLERIGPSDEFAYLLSSSDYTGEFHTVKDWSYRSIDMAGPGYFAVGDAACFVDPILSSGVYLAVLFAKMCAIAVNTCLSRPDREGLVGEWYQGLYNDAYADYLEMARLWYHGDRKVQSWMQSAQDQLGSEEATVYTETERSSFIGLATGNAHTHPNYVVRRELGSFPYPLHLRKDPQARDSTRRRTPPSSPTPTPPPSPRSEAHREGGRPGRDDVVRAPADRPDRDARRSAGLGRHRSTRSPTWSRPARGRRSPCPPKCGSASKWSTIEWRWCSPRPGPAPAAVGRRAGPGARDGRSSDVGRAQAMATGTATAWPASSANWSGPVCWSAPPGATG